MIIVRANLMSIIQVNTNHVVFTLKLDFHQANGLRVDIKGTLKVIWQKINII